MSADQYHIRTIIPAKAGFYALEFCQETGEYCGRTPIIAWLVECESGMCRPTARQSLRNFKSHIATPIMADLVSDDAQNYLLYPDGTCAISCDRNFPTLAELKIAMLEEAAERNKKQL